MVNRRTLVVGGGAAALTVMVGGPSPATASTGRTITTAEHARGVLNSVSVDLGLADSEAAERRLTEGITSYLASAPRDPAANDLHAWAEQRVVDLTGSRDSFGNAMLEIPQTRTLLAFTFLFSAQHQDLQPPAITRSMPVPTVLARLESDFFPVLLGEIETDGKSRRALTDLLRASSAELDRFVEPGEASRPASDLLISLAVSLIMGVVVYFDTK